MENGKATKLAHILGAIYGDGCFAHNDQNGRVHFGNTDRKFIEKVISESNSLFDLNLSMRIDKLSQKNIKWKDFHSFSSRRLYRQLAKFDFKKTRLIPAFIFNGSKSVKASFISGFFDAEGTVDIRKLRREKGNLEIQRHLSCFSNDTELLIQVKSLLADLGIKSSIFHNKKKTYYISIWNYRSLNIFHDLIGFTIQRKMRKLKTAIEGYKLIQTRWDYDTYNSVIALRKMGLGPTRIKENLLRNNVKITIPTIESWIYKGYKPLKPEVT